MAMAPFRKKDAEIAADEKFHCLWALDTGSEKAYNRHIWAVSFLIERITYAQIGTAGIRRK